MTAVEPRPDSPSPPRRAWASLAQLAPGGRRSRRAPSSTRLAPSPRGRPRLPRALRLPVGNQGGGGWGGGAPTRKRHIRSRKDPPPEQTLFGQRLIWSGPIWPCRFRLWEEGRAGVGAGASWELQAPGPGGHCCCSNTRLSRSLSARDAGAGRRVEVPTTLGWEGFTSLRVLPAGPSILGLPASHIWPCTSRRRRARAVPDP